MEHTLIALEKRIDTFQVNSKLIETHLTKLSLENQEIIKELSEIPMKINETEEEIQKKENLLRSYETLKNKFNKNVVMIPIEFSEAKLKRCRYYLKSTTSTAKTGKCRFPANTLKTRDPHFWPVVRLGA